MSSQVDFGLGLRPEHYEEIAASPGKVSWFEALSENYMVPGGNPVYWLERIRRDYPIALHGVSLSIGSIDPLDERYLDDLKALADRVQPMWLSDHLCFTGLRGMNMHDLLPLPYTEEALDQPLEVAEVTVVQWVDRADRQRHAVQRHRIVAAEGVEPVQRQAALDHVVLA